MYPKEMWCVKEMKMTKNVRGSERIEVESGKKKNSVGEVCKLRENESEGAAAKLVLQVQGVK